MKTILHLCADIGSDSRPYADAGYNVIKVGKDIGVENFTPPNNVHGIFANPVCTEFSVAPCKKGDAEKGMFLVNHCLRVIRSCNPVFWVLENPASGSLKNFLGRPTATYEPWQYGSPWSKRTALWGKFKMPLPKYTKWYQVEKNPNLYIRQGRNKPGLAFQHKSALKHIPEFLKFENLVQDDMSFRSLCSQNFATAFYEVNP